MNESERRRLRLLTETAWRAAAAAEQGEPSAPSGGIGDVFVVPEVSHLGVEWAVIEEDPSTRRLYAVPADTLRHHGRHDVYVPLGSPCGPLHLRCGLGLWLDSERVGPLPRSGVLGRSEIERALEARASSRLGREEDEDPEYLEWIAEGPARARALLAELSEVPGNERVLAFETGRERAARAHRPVGLWKGVALAASVLLAVALAGGAGLVVELREEIRRLRQETVQPVANPALATLRRLRSGRHEIAVPAEAPGVVFRISDSSLETGTRYRLELRAEDSPRTLWEDGGLRLLEGSEDLVFFLPKSLLAAGRYRLRLSNGEGLAATFEIEIEYLKDEHAP